MLWRRLRRRQLYGFKFRRQAPIGPFIADFVCLSARLVIEIDGPHHDFTQPYDRAREAWFRRHSFRIWRVSADEVLHDVDAVAEAIGCELTVGEES